ncbi:hypothetical protein FNYG_14203 [Fusarium nygamai]|uniref:Uncharacterized protein n=1 Tax=Gibberella nygamai TaxID=42673 RepID=A0A2K0UTL5_GIBNY|nr:hypothetical protein FNYG_14203 [Fusarium nygamai]
MAFPPQNNTYHLRIERQLTIRDILSLRNPGLDVQGNLGAPRNDPTAANILSTQVTQWTDFNIQVLTQAYGDIMAFRLAAAADVQPAPLQVNSIEDIKSKMFQNSIWPRIRESIAEGARAIQSRLSGQTPSAVDMIPGHSLPDNRTSTISFTSGQSRSPLVVSCIVTRAWRSIDLVNPATDTAMRPIRRIATYCISAQTRYGFIATVNEIVVVRVSAKGPGSHTQYHVEWQAVSWNAYGRNVMTVNAALFFLTMMSLNERHRGVCPPGFARPLNLWQRYTGPAGATFYHHLSLRQSFAPPSGAIVEDGPLF